MLTFTAFGLCALCPCFHDGEREHTCFQRVSTRYPNLFLKGLGEIHERGIIYCESGPSRVYARYTLVSSKSGVVYESVYVRSLELIFKFPNSVNMMKSMHGRDA